MSGDLNLRGSRFAELVHAARERCGISQDELAYRAGLSRSTIIRWESGRAERPDPGQVRAVCQALGVDPREAAVALGYLTREEVSGADAGLPADLEEILSILQDPAVPEDAKKEWIKYLKYLRARAFADRAAD